MVPQGLLPSNPPLPHSATIVQGRARAEAAAPVAKALQALLAHDVAAWSGLGFDVVKERSVRTVLRGPLAGIAVHIKVFRADKLSDRARDVLRGPRGEREVANLLRATALGLPTVEPLASGMATDGDQLRSFVITRTVSDAEPFHFAMAPAVQRRVGALLRTMHARGMLPGDLHPGNLLVDRDGAPWLLDLTSVRHAGEASLVRRADALAFFCHELDGGALDRSARELLTAYLAGGPALPEAFRRELTLATHRWRAAALPAFGRRATRDCRHTEVQEHRRGWPRWYWHRLAPPALRELCSKLAAAPPAPVKSGRRGAVWITEHVVGKQREAGASKKLWRAAYWLLFARVDAPTPVALRTFQRQGLVCTVRVPNDPLAVELAQGRLDERAILAAARSLGDNVGRLHAHGLRNRDLKLDNLVRDPVSGRVFMVDLDGVSRKAVPDARGRGTDLGRLLAGFRAAGSPGGERTVHAFVRSYLRAHRTLLQQPPLRRLERVAVRRAKSWASAHRAG